MLSVVYIKVTHKRLLLLIRPAGDLYLKTRGTELAQKIMDVIINCNNWRFGLIQHDLSRTKFSGYISTSMESVIEYKWYCAVLTVWALTLKPFTTKTAYAKSTSTWQLDSDVWSHLANFFKGIRPQTIFRLPRHLLDRTSLFEVVA